MLIFSFSITSNASSLIKFNLIVLQDSKTIESDNTVQQLFGVGKSHYTIANDEKK